LVGHKGACANIHGHNAVVFVHAVAEKLNDLGMVVDFAVLKEKVGGWIDSNWDHGFICCSTDSKMTRLVHSTEKPLLAKVFSMEGNPTAENMAKYLLEHVGPKVLEGTGVKLVKVDFWETENCFATAELCDD